MGGPCVVDERSKSAFSECPCNPLSAVLHGVLVGDIEDEGVECVAELRDEPLTVLVPPDTTKDPVLGMHQCSGDRAANAGVAAGHDRCPALHLGGQGTWAAHRVERLEDLQQCLHVGLLV